MRRARPEWADWLARARASSRWRRSTRARSSGACATTARCAARSATAPAEELHARALAQPHLDWPRMLAEPELASPPPALDACVTEPFTVGTGPRVVVLDLGCKRSIVRRLVESGVEAVVVPGTWDADAVLELEPAAVLVGNGPGDPAQLDGPVETVRDAARAACRSSGSASATSSSGSRSACETFKLPFGHRGANHPVRVTGTKRVLVTAQNHGFAVAPGDAAEVSHVSLNDGTVEGLARRRLRDAPVPPRGRAGPARRRPLLRPDRGRVPKRTDLRSILIVGSGPIRIGQGCEFDYAGVQACRALRAEGYRVVLVELEPGDDHDRPRVGRRDLPRAARRPTLAEIIEREQPDALLPTLGGQTALNLAVELAEAASSPSTASS